MLAAPGCSNVCKEGDQKKMSDFLELEIDWWEPPSGCCEFNAGLCKRGQCSCTLSCLSSPMFYVFIFLLLPGIQPQALCMVGKHSTAELHSQPLIYFSAVCFSVSFIWVVLCSTEVILFVGRRFSSSFFVFVLRQGLTLCQFFQRLQCMEQLPLFGIFRKSQKGRLGC